MSLSILLKKLEVVSHPLIGLVPEARVRAIRAGSGKLDSARDFVALPGVFTEFRAPLAGKHPFPEDKLEFLGTLGSALVQEIKPGRARNPTPRRSAVASGRARGHFFYSRTSRRQIASFIMTFTDRDNSSPPPPRIVRIAVRKLFGVLDHDIELKRAERVTIIHGINGVGKTKLLELTAALTRGQLWRLLEVPFEELRIEFDDSTAVEAQSTNAQLNLKLPKDQSRARRRARRRPANITFRRFNVTTSENIKTLSAESIAEDMGSVQERLGFPPWVTPLSNGMWLDTRLNRALSSQELTRRYGFPRAAFEQLGAPNDRLRELVPCEPAHLIETQRLLRIGGRRVPPLSGDDEAGPLVMTVHELAAELKQNISNVQNEFFRRTQALDRTLTERVLQAELKEDSLGENLRLRLEALSAHRERLERAGLLDAGTFGPTLAPADAEALRGDRALMIAVHTDDAEQKFKVLDPLATRLELLLHGMNEKLAYPKKLVLDHDRELSVQRHGETIALDQLSSGEQHELVLLYDLAFRIQPNTLVLIDEPELSLHPVWQQQFLEEIIKIAKNGAFDVLIATHSPYIIGNRNDLCVELKAEARP